MKRLQVMAAVLATGCLCVVFQAHSAEQSGAELLRTARELSQKGQYFKSARYAFAATQTGDLHSESEAYSWVTVGLVHAGLPQAAAYFYIRTLQGGERAAIRRVLTQTDEIVSHVGPDLLRKYLVTHSRLDDYDSSNRSAFLYLLGKTALLGGQYSKAIENLNAVSPSSSLYPYALQEKGAARAILGQNEAAIRDFEDCIARANKISTVGQSESHRLKVEDLKARCQAGIARTYYQSNQFKEADEAYDKIAKASFVWTDILFEQAWNAFAQQEYNRSLGKLVTYKSPALKFVYNSEVDVLRAQSFLALCQYKDANEVINQFNSAYTRTGEEVKRFVESNSDHLEAFFVAGKRALKAPLHTDNGLNRMLNRFVRGPYFQTLVASESEINRELGQVERQSGVGNNADATRGFPGFLRRVLEWRAKTARYLGGAFVKNGMVDYHSVLISDFEKMAFIKLEMLRRAKEKLIDPEKAVATRGRGSKEPERKPYQYRWSFNGEFWVDELGDYVFGLESECDRS